MNAINQIKINLRCFCFWIRNNGGFRKKSSQNSVDKRHNAKWNRIYRNLANKNCSLFSVNVDLESFFKKLFLILSSPIYNSQDALRLIAHIAYRIKAFEGTGAE